MRQRQEIQILLLRRRKVTPSQMSAQTTEGESRRELRETATASQPPRQESGDNDRGPSADRRVDLSATGSARDMVQKSPAADPAGYDVPKPGKSYRIDGKRYIVRRIEDDLVWAELPPLRSIMPFNLWDWQKFNPTPIEESKPDPAGYETMYLRFLTLKCVSPHLAHKDHEPWPAQFGLDDREAAFLRVKIEREFYRGF